VTPLSFLAISSFPLVFLPEFPGIDELLSVQAFINSENMPSVRHETGKPLVLCASPSVLLTVTAGVRKGTKSDLFLFFSTSGSSLTIHTGRKKNQIWIWIKVSKRILLYTRFLVGRAKEDPWIVFSQETPPEKRRKKIPSLFFPFPQPPFVPISLQHLIPLHSFIGRDRPEQLAP
jgi:hypothetical protein